MDKWNLIIDVALCNNCASCSLAVMDEHVGNNFPGYAAPLPKDGKPWLEIRRRLRGEGEHVDVSYMPTMCNHCDKPACAQGSAGAVVKRNDGIVIIDPVKAKGRRDLVDQCPYGAMRWNEELQLPQAWIFDAHLLDAGWTVPRCQQACATGAMRALKVSDSRMNELAREQSLQVDRPEYGTAPRVYYKNLHRILCRFVAGSVVAAQGGMADCLEGCAVTLLRDGNPVARTVTDWFGDFKIDRLPDEAVAYELLFEHPDQQPLRMPVQTDVSGKSVGVVMLQAQPLATPQNAAA